ncbi:thiol-disulfide isomerase/thioredoxin [Dysgonomonas sp. PH5-45]|uniref:peroxiredoxin family protein n=1 Tax=unclassified Dysgonomonas TaxID=2630389 RepID=UPI0024760E22|nr:MULTISPECIES: redoxin domain-containing protein [unclassified Dysgonomonas]MDH6355620.1 thiol-disulfide isomerase/thioredoxin [Dysgonomonas sp. PH5-45]MDH6388517.1 thiol-disulfide isomerase/thioredoxin [Dysgonomonas sp. PH5-37]
MIISKIKHIFFCFPLRVGLFLLLCGRTGVDVSAQTIEMHLPSCNYLQYVFTLKQGTARDTVAVGRLDSVGKASFTLPAGYASYRGVGNLSVPTTHTSINMIINGEKEICVKEGDSPDSGIFSGSPENTYLLESFARQGRILGNYNEVMNSGTTISPFASPLQQLESINDEYKKFRKDISASPLYAARMVEILGCLTSLGSSLDIHPDSIIVEQHRFISRKLDFHDLYTSGFWEPTIQFWYESAMGNDSLLLNDSKHMLDKISDIPLRRELTQSFIRMFSKYGKDYLLAELGTEYLTLPLNGHPAPEIVVGDSSFVPHLSLIMFYETGCGNCHYELEQLKSKYKLLTDNNIRVISIAADTGEEVHAETSAKLPWADKLCDFKGFEGDNFRNYGIVGTPTFILTDKDGIVRGRYAQLKELLKD